MAEKNIFGKDSKKKDKDKNSKTVDDRGAADDWEAIAMILHERPGLKSRVLHHIRSLKSKQDNKGTRKQTRQEVLEQKRKEQSGK